MLRLDGHYAVERFVSSHDERICSLHAGVDPHALGLQILSDRVDAVLAPEAGVLIAAEWGHVAYSSVAVDPDHASLDFFRYPDGSTDILGPYAGAQAKPHTVGDGNGFDFILEPDNRKHWAKYFFLCDSHAVFHVAEDRGLDEPAAAAFRCCTGLATEQQRCPVLL